MLEIMDGGGKRSATPLSNERELPDMAKFTLRPKAPSPLRSAGAVQTKRPRHTAASA